ncbi:MAG: hypothetical protein PHU93_01130 [Candidatus Gracilibacteria bacterium]|nr:hypothetical protein [Candidatus Gracilibacteria bacterium]
MSNLGVCTYSNLDTLNSVITGLDCPNIAPVPLYLSGGFQKFEPTTASGSYLPLLMQTNDGSIYISRDMYNTSLLLFWLLPIGFSILFYFGIRFYRLGAKKD